MIAGEVEKKLEPVMVMVMTETVLI